MKVLSFFLCSLMHYWNIRCWYCFKYNIFPSSFHILLPTPQFINIDIYRRLYLGKFSILHYGNSGNFHCYYTEKSGSLKVLAYVLKDFNRKLRVPRSGVFCLIPQRTQLVTTTKCGLISSNDYHEYQSITPCSFMSY